MSTQEEEKIGEDIAWGKSLPWANSQVEESKAIIASSDGLLAAPLVCSEASNSPQSPGCRTRSAVAALNRTRECRITSPGDAFPSLPRLALAQQQGLAQLSRLASQAHLMGPSVGTAR